MLLLTLLVTAYREDCAQWSVLDGFHLQGEFDSHWIGVGAVHQRQLWRRHHCIPYIAGVVIAGLILVLLSPLPFVPQVACLQWSGQSHRGW